jgi:RNA 2',3'-cyclic 3'-phosphodiesterase
MSDPEPGASGGEPTERLFLALDLPAETIARISRWQASASGSKRLRAVPADSLHMTLAFLDQRPRSEVPALAALVADVGAEVGAEPVTGVLRPEPVPVPRRRPKLLALDVDSPAAARLQGRLSDRLRALGSHRAPERPFWPHVTVFRIRARGSGTERGARAKRLDPLPAGDGHAFGFVRLALYRSDLRPEGSSYSRLAANELPQPGGRQKR